MRPPEGHGPLMFCFVFVFAFAFILEFIVRKKKKENETKAERTPIPSRHFVTVVRTDSCERARP